MARRKKKAEDTVAEFKQGDYSFMETELGKQVKGTEVVDPTIMEHPEGNSTGSLSLDFDLGIPCPEGTMVEIMGDEGSLKTALALSIVGSALKKGKDAIYINLENSGNKRSFDNVTTIREATSEAGHKFRMVNADTGEGALHALRMFCEQFPKGVAVFDSIDACVPEAVLAKNIGDSAVGDLSKLMSDACRKLITIIRKTGATIIWINQMREKIGVMFGDPRTTSGGRAVKFYSRQRIEMLSPGKGQVVVDNGGEQIGVRMRYKIIKSTFAPKTEGEVPLLFGHGVFIEYQIIEEALNLGLLLFGGAGGKQVLLPKRKPREKDDQGNFIGDVEYFDVDKADKSTYTAMKKLNAARRLLMDKSLRDMLLNRVLEIVDPLRFEAANDFMETDEDEILDTEGPGSESEDRAEPVSVEEPGGE